MKKIALLLIQFVIGFNLLIAQSNLELEKVISFGESAYVLIMTDNRWEPSYISIQLYDLKEQLLSERQLNLKEQELARQFQGAFAWNNQLCILTSVYEASSKRNALVLQTMDIPDLNDGKKITIDEAFSAKDDDSPFGYHQSENGEFLAFYSWTNALAKDPARLNIKVINPELEEVWSQRHLLPFQNERFEAYQCAINSRGKVFIFCKKFLTIPGKTIPEKKVEHFLLAAQRAKKTLQQYDINLPNRTITGLKIQMAANDTIIGAAFIRDKQQVNLIEGLYLLSIPPNDQGIQKSTFALTNKMYKLAYPYGKKESFFNYNRHRFSSFITDHIWIEKDGSCVIAAEYRRNPDNRFTTEFNDILVLKINKEKNRLNWIKRLPKRQTGASDPLSYYSYQALKNGNRYFFIFNDHINNHDQLGPPKRLAEFKYMSEEAAIIMMMVGASGELQKYDLTAIARKRKVSAICPARIEQISNNKKVILYGEQNSGKQGFARILFNFAWEDYLN